MLNPNNRGAFRCGVEDSVVANCNLHATLIPKDAIVPGTQPAMFDDRVVDCPNEFGTGRPSYIYMLGFGLQTCFGEYTNRHAGPTVS